MTQTFKFEGRERRIFKRGGNWSLRLYVDGKDRWISLKTGILGSAIEAAKNIIKAHRETRAEDFAAALGQRPRGEITVGNIVAAFNAAPLAIARGSRAGYLWALRSIIETVHGKEPAWTDHPLSILNGDLIFKYRKGIMATALAAGAGAAALERAKRSANSALRQARSIFSEHLMEHYRIEAGLSLPAGLSGFRSAPGFRGAVKTDYQPPDDALIQKTLGELEATRELHPDRYLACWLSLGFGLRKSEVSALKGDSFFEINGRPHVELRSVTVIGGECDLTKNGTQAPRVPVANDAWRRIGPMIEHIPAGHYLIAGTMTYRTEGMFREINDWLRALGWKTQKGFHELRAYAGCQVALRSGLLEASKWLRHESVTTTQAAYGRYLKIQVTDAPMSLAPPTDQSGGGAGRILAAGAALMIGAVAVCS